MMDFAMDLIRKARGMGAGWIVDPVSSKSLATLKRIHDANPTRRERDCLAAIGIAQSVSVYARENGIDPETEQSMDMLDLACGAAFLLLPALKKVDHSETIGRRFDKLADSIFTGPAPITEYIDFSLGVIDSHLARIKNKPDLATALKNIVSALYAVRANYDPDCEEISETSGRAAVAWEVSS